MSDEVSLDDLIRIDFDEIGVNDVVFFSKNRKNVLTSRKFILQKILKTSMVSRRNLETKLKEAMKTSQLTIENSIFIPRWQKSIKQLKRFSEITEDMIEEIQNKLRQSSPSSPE